ncbi:MAG: hypothetical protein GWN62_23735 [Aliifodinibius sp.]|nr:hypothetical protein [Fodinibius sp.]
MKTISRRQFIRNGLCSVGGFLSLSQFGLIGCASRCPKAISAENRKNRSRRVLADLHVHPLMESWLSRSPQLIQLNEMVPGADKVLFQALNQTEVTWETSHQAGVDMMCVAHLNAFDEFASMPTDPNPDAPRQTLRMIEMLERELEGPAKPYARLARNAKELEYITTLKKKNLKEYRIAVLHAFEGGHTLGGSVEPLKEFAKRGVAMIAITHFFNKGIATSANSIPYFPDNQGLRAKRGLSEFGLEVIEKMEELGIIVDVSHGTSTTVEEVLTCAKKPIISSHSAARTLGHHPKSLYDEHIQEIANKGGIIGVILMPYWLSNYSDATISSEEGSLDDVVRTIRYIYKICGNDHKSIGIGTDVAGFIPPPRDIKCHGNIELLRDKLWKEFEDVNIVEDIMAQNAINFFIKNWQSGLPDDGEG